MRLVEVFRKYTRVIPNAAILPNNNSMSEFSQRSLFDHSSKVNDMV